MTDRLPLLDDGVVGSTSWATPPVPAHARIGECLWAPDAAPGATVAREALRADGAGDPAALDAYEQLWFGRIAPRAAAAPWDDARSPLAPAWRPAPGRPVLWARCYLLESVMLARLRAALLLASARHRPPTHADSARAYGAAAAAYRYAADTVASWANLPPTLGVPELTVAANDGAARLCEALCHGAVLTAASARLDPLARAAAWRSVGVMCGGTAGADEMAPLALAMRRASRAARAEACRAAAAEATSRNAYGEACALQRRAVADARDAGCGARAVDAETRRLGAMEAARRALMPGAAEPDFAEALLPPPAPLPRPAATFPPTLAAAG